MGSFIRTTVIRVATWALRYMNKTLARRKGQEKISGPWKTFEIETARRRQRVIPEDLTGPHF